MQLRFAPKPVALPREEMQSSRWKRILLQGTLLTTFAFSSLCSHAQEETPAPSEGAPISGTDSLNRAIPRGEYQVEPEFGLPAHKLFRDTGAPYTHSLRNLEFSPEAHLGSVEAGVHLDVPDPYGRFPLLDRGFAPEDADLKLGFLYFKLRALSAGLFVSDNIDLKEDDRKAEAIAIIRLTASVVAQITEGLQIAVSGSFVYLPFENRAGFAGFGLFAPYTFGLGAQPALESQVTWDTVIGGWNVVFADNFRIGTANFALSYHDDFVLFDGGDFRSEAGSRRYTFIGRTGEPAGQNTHDRTDLEVLYFSNTVSASVERLLPGPIRLHARAYHENLWYNQGGRGLPTLRDGFSLLLRSERENMRFKPFLEYRTQHTSQSSGFNQEVRLGVDGPITDQLVLHADNGWYHYAGKGSNFYIWNVGLLHHAGPYTEESLQFERSVSDFDEFLRDHITYRIHQILGPKLSAAAYISTGELTDLNGNKNAHERIRAGLLFSSDLGPRTRATLGGTYSQVDSGADPGFFEIWTGRFTLSYRFTDTLYSHFIYQYQERDSDREGESYYENLFFLTLTKYFD